MEATSPCRGVRLIILHGNAFVGWAENRRPQSFFCHSALAQHAAETKVTS